MKSKGIVNKKTKSLATVMTILVILIVGTPLCLLGYYKYNEYTIKKETYDYLYSKGYEENEIKKVEVIIEIGPLLSTIVEFADEPNVLYWYDKRDGEIVQIGIYEPNAREQRIYESNDGESKFKHSE